MATWRDFAYVAFVIDSFSRRIAGWRLSRSLKDVEFATLEWVWWFNYHRLLGPIGQVPPVEAEETYYRAQEAPTEPLRLEPGGLR